MSDVLYLQIIKSDGVFTCVHSLGRHSIAVILDGEPVKGSPFACNIYDVSKVKISGLGPTKVRSSILQGGCSLLK
jgi:filamin